MNLIRPPAHPGRYEDRFLDLQGEIDTPLIDLVSDACRAGWKIEEVLAAVVEVADNLMLASIETESVTDLLKRVK